MKFFSIVAIALLASLAFVPMASAVGKPEPICDPSKTDAVSRAKCAAVDTVNNVLGVAEPVTTFAFAEAAYYSGVVCQIIDHNIGGQTCATSTDTVFSSFSVMA